MDDYVKSQTDRFSGNPVTFDVTSVHKLQQHCHEVNVLLSNFLRVMGPMKMSQIASHIDYVPADLKNSVMSVFGTSEDFIRKQSHVFYVDPISNLVSILDIGLGHAVKYFVNEIKRNGPMEMTLIIKFVYIKQVPDLLVISKTFTTAEQFINRMNHVFCTKNGLVSLVENRYDHIEKATFVLDTNAEKQVQPDCKPDSTKKYQAQMDQSVHVQNKISTKESQAELGQSVSMMTKTRETAMPDTLVRNAVDFLVAVLKKRGTISLQTLTGHLSQLPKEIRNITGKNPKGLRGFANKHPEIFYIHLEDIGLKIKPIVNSSVSKSTEESKSISNIFVMPEVNGSSDVTKYNQAMLVSQGTTIHTTTKTKTTINSMASSQKTVKRTSDYRTVDVATEQLENKFMKLEQLQLCNPINTISQTTSGLEASGKDIEAPGRH